MSQNKKVLNLFGFLMDLLDENITTTTKEPVEETKEEITEPIEDTLYKLANPNLPPHPVLNPMVEYTNPLKNIAPHAVDLIKKMEALDKENGIELMKKRTVNKAVKPLTEEIKKLKEEAHKNALSDKDIETKDYLSLTGERVGVALGDGKIQLVDVPYELRNHIPMDGKEGDIRPISKEMQAYLEKVSEKISNKEETTPASNHLPQAIKDAMMNVKEVSEPMESPTQYIPDLSNGEIVYKPKPKAKAKVKPRKTKKK